MHHLSSLVLPRQTSEATFDSLGVLIGDMVKPYAKTVREVSGEEIVYTGTGLTLEEHKIVERLVKMSRKCTEIAPEKRYKSIERN